MYGTQFDRRGGHGRSPFQRLATDALLPGPGLVWTADAYAAVCELARQVGVDPADG